MKAVVQNAETKKVNIFVIHTPFHLVQLERMIRDKVIDRSLSSIIFHSEFVNLNIIKALFDYNEYQIFLLPKNTFSLKRLILSIFIEGLSLVKLIQQYNRIIKNAFLHTEYTSVILFSGTDKDIFDQTLYYQIDKYFKSVKIVFDEGIGLYIKKNKYDKWLNFLISKFTKIIFKVPLISINKLGSNPKSQIIYARFPELVYKEKNKQYFKINFESNIKPKYGNYILILGRPIFEGHTLEKNEYETFLNYLFDAIGSNKVFNKFSISLKPHPRESISFYKGYHIDHVLSKTSLESIGEIFIGMIVCFDSSALLEIIGSGVDPNRVVNITFRKNSIISELFNLNDIYFDGNLENFRMSLENRFAQFLEKYA
jgi:hypothetical protein